MTQYSANANTWITIQSVAINSGYGSSPNFRLCVQAKWSLSGTTYTVSVRLIMAGKGWSSEPYVGWGSIHSYTIKANGTQIASGSATEPDSRSDWKGSDTYGLKSGSMASDSTTYSKQALIKSESTTVESSGPEIDCPIYGQFKASSRPQQYLPVTGTYTLDSNSLLLPMTYTNPSFTGSISINDSTPATGTAAGSGFTATYSYSGSWNSDDNANRKIYLEISDGSSTTMVKDCGTATSASSATVRVTGLTTAHNKIAIICKWFDSGGSTHWSTLASTTFTTHTYVNPSFAGSQTVPASVIVGTSSVSVPYSITTYTLNDYVDEGDYFYHFDRYIIKNGSSSSENIQLKSISKSVHSGTSTFNSGLSSLDPNDKVRFYIEKAWKNASNTSQYAGLAQADMLIAHRECNAPTGVSFSYVNRSTNQAVSTVIKGYSYDLKVSWTAPSDWGTRSGNRMTHLYYYLQSASNYDVSGGSASSSQNHNVAIFTPTSTGSSTYYVQLYAYVGSTSNKSSTVTKYLSVTDAVKPTATGVSLSAAAVTTSSNPTLLMADTPNWGNTQNNSSRQATYELFIDGTHDSYHYVAPGGSKQITAQGDYGWGSHTAYVKAKYETDLGSNTYTTNTVNIEIGGYPLAPTVSVSPLSIPAGQSRTITWSFTPSDWNLSQGRCFTYKIYVDSTQKESGTLTASITSKTYTQIFSEACAVKMVICQTNSLGSSSNVESTAQITAPTPPTAATLNYTNVPLALPNQSVDLSITREDNGTYAQSEATIDISIYRNASTHIATLVSSSISMTQTTYSVSNKDFSAYVDGTYWIRTVYTKKYTTGLTKVTTKDIVILPPEVQIDDNSYVQNNNLYINFDIRNTYDATNPYYIEYSLDYGATWTRQNNVMTYTVPSDYLYEIQIRAYGKNPVDELMSPVYTHEIPSQYHLKASSIGGTVQTLRRVWACNGNNARRKLKRIKKVQ